MKAILEFNLDDLDDRMAHLRAVNSLNLVLTISEISEYLRKEYKYEEGYSQIEFELIKKIREKVLNILIDNNIDLEQLIN